MKKNTKVKDKALPTSGSVKLTSLDTYREVVKYCDDNGIFIGRWVTKTLQKELDSFKAKK